MRVLPLVIFVLFVSMIGCDSVEKRTRRAQELYNSGQSHKALALLEAEQSLTTVGLSARDNCIWSIYERYRFSNPDSAYYYLRRATPDGPLWDKFTVEIGEATENLWDLQTWSGAPIYEIRWGGFAQSQARRLTLASTPIGFSAHRKLYSDAFHGTEPYLLACAMSGEEPNPRFLSGFVNKQGRYTYGPSGMDGGNKREFLEWLNQWSHLQNDIASSLSDSILFSVKLGPFTCGKYEPETGSFPIDLGGDGIVLAEASQFMPDFWETWGLSGYSEEGDIVVRRIILDISDSGADLTSIKLEPKAVSALLENFRKERYSRSVGIWVVFTPEEISTRDVFRVRNVERLAGFESERVRTHFRESTIKARLAAAFVTASGRDRLPINSMIDPSDRLLADKLSRVGWNKPNADQVIKVLFPTSEKSDN